jgi:glutamate N-acetyltransferase/amino-acid N-acetyltransferase
VSFFESRWVEAPAHARESSGLPQGFRAAGVACGIKPSGGRDLGLLVSDVDDTVSAALFTRSGVLAAPVLLCQERCELQRLRAIAANSGCANAATGRRGLDAAAKMQGAAAMALGVPESRVALASTGAISHDLPVDQALRGVLAASGELRADGDVDLADAIRTTDRWPKRASLEVTLPGGTVKLAAQAKGAGMISPAFATMFCFVQTDAELAAETAELLLGVTTKRSFERISVDGQLSTNDTAVLMASGASGVKVAPESDDELRFGEALDAVMRQLALMIVGDGEGATRTARVIVRGGHELHVEAVARAVANSPLVKAALNGGDPNWGRIVQAAGMALPGTAPLPIDVTIEGIPVCRAGVGTSYEEGSLARAVAGKEVEFELALPGEGADTEVFFCDLSHEYVTINAEYTT